MEQNISLSRGERIIYFLVTILLPVASFLITTLHPDIVSPIYVNENLSDYALILLRGDTSIYFYPFLVYSMICMFLFLWSPERYSISMFIRFGIYTGTLLALQYSIIMLIAFSGYFIFGYLLLSAGLGVGLLVPIIIKWVYSNAKKKIGNRNILYILAGLFLIVLLLSVINDWDWFSLFMLLIFSILVSGPFWCLVISTRISIKLIKTFGLSKQEKRKFGVGIVAWLVPFLISWRLAYQKMLDIYTSLPTSPPHCYIATAVAKGHPYFVRSKPVAFESECEIWVNSQLRVFKCAELFLCTVWPRAHRIVRAIYDVLGPPLSRLIIHPTQADAIYIILKPVEWLTKGILRVIIPDFEQLADTIY